MQGQLIEAPKAEEVREYRMLVGGEWVESGSGKTFKSTNPYTGRVWATAQEADEADVDRAVWAAREAFEEGPWGRTTATERARLMRRLAGLIADNAEDLATVECVDNGKLLREMSGQLKALPEWYYYFAGAADKIQGATIPSNNPNFFVYTRKEPVGVVGAIVPWNSPLLLLTWKLAPALAAGCTFVAKTAEQTPASTLEFAKLFEEAGFPPGVFNVITGYGTPTGSALVRHPEVDKVAFTGSTETGKLVMKDAADHVAKVSLELGGKSPNIVFEDADLEAVANGVVSGIFAATGQTCMAGSRLLVQEGLHDPLVERLAEKAASIRMGDPLQMETEMGPVAFKEQLEKIQGYVESGQSEGAELVYGGKSPEDPELRDGFFIQPTILAGVDDTMKVAREEIFGPVLSVIPAGSEEEVVRQANDTPYGLAAAVWTNDIRRAHRVAHAFKGWHGLDQRLPQHLVQRAVRRLQAERHRKGERHRGPGGVHPDQDRLGRTLRGDPRPIHARVVRRRAPGGPALSGRRWVVEKPSPPGRRRGLGRATSRPPLPPCPCAPRTLRPGRGLSS